MKPPLGEDPGPGPNGSGHAMTDAFLDEWNRLVKAQQEIVQQQYRAFEKQALEQDELVKSFLGKIAASHKEGDAKPRTEVASLPDRGQSSEQSLASGATMEDTNVENDANKSVPKSKSGKIGHIYTAAKDEVKSHTKLASWQKSLRELTQKAEEPQRTGRFAKAIDSNWFSLAANLVVLLTVVNSLVIANYKVTYLREEPKINQTLAEVLTGCFILEILLKIMVHRAWFFVNEDWAWNCMDTLLAGIELWNFFQGFLEQGEGLNLTFLRSLRILKITRVLRMVRLVQAFKQLRILLDAMISSAATVMWCGVVILFTLVMVALIFVQFVTEWLMENPEDLCIDPNCLVNGNCGGECLHYGLKQSFGSVAKALLSLFMATTGGVDWQRYYYQLDGIGTGPSVAFVVFTFCFQFGMFNLLTSMFVDQAIKASKPDAEIMIIEQRTQEMETASVLKVQFAKYDSDLDGKLSYDEFETMIRDPGMSSFLAATGLEIPDAEMFFKVLADIAGYDSVPIDSFVQGCMRLKGTATSIDMQAMHFEVRCLDQKMSDLCEMLRNQKKAELPSGCPGNPEGFPVAGEVSLRL